MTLDTKGQTIFNMEELTPAISPESITERITEREPLEDDTFLEVNDKETGEMTKYPMTVLTPSQLIREHKLLPLVPETGQPLPYIPLEKLPPELQKAYQAIKNMIDEMNKDHLEARDLNMMFGYHRTGEDIASTTLGRRPEGARYGKDRVIAVYDPQGVKAVGLYFAALIEHHPGRVEIGIMIRRSHRGKGFFTKLLEKEMKLTLSHEISAWHLQVSRRNAKMVDICERFVRKRRFHATMVPFEHIRKEMTAAKRAAFEAIKDELTGEKHKQSKQIPTVTDQEVYEYVHYVLTREADAVWMGHKQPGNSFYASAEYEILTNSLEAMHDHYWA